MSTELLDNLNPEAVVSETDFRTWMGHARTVLVEAHKSADKVGTVERAVADLSNRLTAALETMQAPRISRDVTGTEADLVSRYMAPKAGSTQGTIRLTGKTEVVQYAGRTFELHMPGILDDRELSCEWQRDLQKAVGDRSVVRGLVQKGTPTPYMDEQVIRLCSTRWRFRAR